MIASRFVTIPAQKAESLWLPEQASTIAVEVDEAFWLVFWISTVFFAIIVAAQAWFMYVYRHRAGWMEQNSPHHNYVLELSWSIIPSLLLLVMFIKGFAGFLDMRTPPADAYDVTVVAKKWSWSFVYPNGVVSKDLHAPVERPVRLIMSSDDVIHSLWVPAFRVKQDIVPGRYNYLWFDATEEGEFPLQCTEYCGTNHSEMLAKAIIHPEGEFAPWLAEQKVLLNNMPPVKLGELLYNERGCSQCHALDDTRRVGPGFAQTFGNVHEIKGGATVQGDENYIRESIMNPQAQVRAGFEPTMPTYKGLLDDVEINGLVSFIKSKSPTYELTPADTEPRKPEGAAAPAEGADAEGDATSGGPS